MSKWEKVKLSEVCTVNPPKKQLQTLYENNKLISFIPMSEVSEDGKVNTKIERSYSEVSSGFTYFTENDVLFAKITPCMENGKGGVARGLINGLGVGSTEFHVLRPNETVTSDWIHRFLSYSKFRKLAEKNMTGSAGQRRVPKAFLEKVRIPLPPLETQKRVNKKLDTVSELLAMRKQQLAELDNLIKATFYKMFGEPFRNDFKWDRVVLKDYLKLFPQNGLYKHQSKYGSGTKIVRIDSFYDGYVENISSLKRLSLEPEEIEQYALNKDDILINRVNSIEYLGKVGIVPDITEDIVYESNMMRFRLNQEYLIPIFLMYLWRTQFIKAQIRGRAKNAVNQSSVNQQDVLSFTVVKPPLSLQNQFANIVTKIEEQKAIVKQAIDETQHLFDSLMSEYFE
ncbi:restriction endonuclease subunit S [Paenibacillus sp. FSL P4-0081]|uniref:restriction endonuclease subunit S n=1 Tax=Paenibacillus sp. FSL P4-0081 TaxID=1536769 RepID=UPI000693C6D9|nr:restriction endonuclease subunit S [Paenibacillus sp. FSL P4-0081]